MDDDIFGFSEPTKPITQPPIVNQPQTVITQPTYINPMYSTTASMAAHQNQGMQPSFINPMYGTTGPLAAQNIAQSKQQQFINPMYSTTAPLAAQNAQTHMNYMHPMHPSTSPTGTQGNTYFSGPVYNPTVPLATNNYQLQQQQQQNWAFNPPQNPYMNVNPMYGQTAPMVAQQQNISQGISLSSTPKNDDFGNFQSGSTSGNVGWLSDK